MNIDSLKYLLNSIYNSSFSSLKTGTDKVTRNKFSSIKDEEFGIILRKCSNRSYKFTRPKKIRVKNRTVLIPTIRDFLLLEALRRLVEQKLFIKYPDRDKIIRKLKQKLKSKQNYYVIRLDIKNFFDSIPHNFLLKKLKERHSLSIVEYYLLKEYLLLAGRKGVPTGISLSNILSEFYLMEIDKNLQSIHPRISSYFRYVDDIIILINGDIDTNSELLSLKQSIRKAFLKEGLKLNLDKQKDVNFNFDNTKHEEFEYLGYKFKKRGLKVETLLSNKKEKEIKGKIKFIFEEYGNEENLDLLIERLGYISRVNTMITSSIKINSRLRSYELKNLIYHGILESYKRVDDSVWEDLDIYLQGNIFSKFQETLNENELKQNLFKNSFKVSKRKSFLNKFHLKDNSFFVDKILSLSDDYEIHELSMMDRNTLEKKYREVLRL